MRNFFHPLSRKGNNKATAIKSQPEGVSDEDSQVVNRKIFYLIQQCFERKIL